VVWIGNERLSLAVREDGKLHSAPELVVEVLSHGPVNQRRDREAKLKLYSRRDVREYWIVDWTTQSVEVYRRKASHLSLFATVIQADSLESPILPGFSAAVSDLFAGILHQ
jgi:Uma2 family endonuclease